MRCIIYVRGGRYKSVFVWTPLKGVVTLSSMHVMIISLKKGSYTEKLHDKHGFNFPFCQLIGNLADSTLG